MNDPAQAAYAAMDGVSGLAPTAILTDVPQHPCRSLIAGDDPLVRQYVGALAQGLLPDDARTRIRLAGPVPPTPFRRNYLMDGGST